MCGAVEFKVVDKFTEFYQCHCHQCQKLTGSAFASNLFTDVANIEWLKGVEEISHFVDLTRDFSKAFCQHCGSALPVVNKTKTALIIPAGSLDNLTNKNITANIFVAEKACWQSDNPVKSFQGFPHN